MKIEERITTLAEWIGATGPIAEANQGGLGDAWAIASEFLDLHSTAIAAFSEARATQLQQQDRAVIALGIHASNVCSSALGMIVSGRHDVAPYLTRVLFDTHTLLLGCGQDAALAERFMQGDEKLAPIARKQFLTALRADGHAEDADWMDQRFKSDYDASNVLAHVGGAQVGRLFESTPTGPRPVFGGHVDPVESELLWRSVLEQEHWALIALIAACGDHLDQTWHSRLRGCQTRLVALMKAHEAEEGKS